MKGTVVCVVLTAIFAAGLVLANEPVVGRWQTIDEKTGKAVSVVHIYDEGGHLFGKITGLTEPTDAAGKPKTCSKCSDADKDKPIIGLVLLKNLVRSGDRYKGGTIIDPEDGKTYKAELWVEDGKLKVRGYVGFFYKTQTWVKAD